MKYLRKVEKRKQIADVVQLSLLFSDVDEYIIKKIYVHNDEIDHVKDYIGKNMKYVMSKDGLGDLFDHMRQLSIILESYFKNYNDELYKIICILSALFIDSIGRGNRHYKKKLRNYGYNVDLYIADQDPFSNRIYGKITRISDSKTVKFEMM